MLPHIQLYEKQLFEHRRHLLHEAEQQRLLTQASQHHTGRVRHLFAGLRKCFTMPSTARQQVERKDELLADCTEETGRELEWQRAGS